MTFVILLAHLAFSVLFGWSLLSFRPHERMWAENLVVSVLVGIYVETLLAATFMFLGLTLVTAGILIAIVMVLVVAAAVRRGALKGIRISVDRPSWFEWALLAAVGEKILFIVWQLTRTHTYFDDALMHWSGRARSLYGAVNWSFDPASPVFLGKHIGNNNYPLETIVWRSLAAKLNGEWNDVISRADGIVFYIAIVATVWLAVWKFSKTRWLAAAAAFIAAALPLHAWHAASGYSDIAVEAFVAASLAALLRREWFIAGLMAAGAVWSKNDALVLYLPCLLVAVIVLRNPRWFLLGFLTVSPWLVFNYIHDLGITGDRSDLEWHSDAPLRLWNATMNNPTSSILWIFVFVTLVYTSRHIIKDVAGRALTLAFAISFLGMLFVFSSTTAYRFLLDESTVHRILMQMSGMAILTMSYGIWLACPAPRPRRRKA